MYFYVVRCLIGGGRIGWNKCGGEDNWFFLVCLRSFLKVFILLWYYWLLFC